LTLDTFILLSTDPIAWGKEDVASGESTVMYVPLPIAHYSEHHITGSKVHVLDDDKIILLYVEI
jgi:hypothetical protein